MTITIRGSLTNSLRDDILAAQNRVVTPQEYVNRREDVAGTNGVITRTIVADGLGGAFGVETEGENVFLFDNGAATGGLTRGVILTGATDWNFGPDEADFVSFSGTFVVGNGSNIVSFVNHGFFRYDPPAQNSVNLDELNEPFGANYDLYRVSNPSGLNSWTGFTWNEATFNNAVGAYAAGNFTPLNNLLNGETYDYFGNGRVEGGNFGDLLISDGGFVNISGGGGNDTIGGSEANNSILNGDGGNDTINGGAGNEFINGGDDNDTINGGLGVNTINGGSGNDTYILGDGADVISDTAGFDLVAFTHESTINFEDGVAIGDPSNDIWNEIDIDRFDGSTGNDTIILTIGATGYREINGGLGNDILGGNADVNKIDAGGGNDFVYGRDGDDILLGGAGIDELNGDSNNDSLQGGFGNDVLNGGLGIDTADFSDHFGSWSGGWTIDVINQTARTQYNGSGQIFIITETDTLNSVENVIGSSGNDTIFARGTGTVQGGQGSDTLVLAATVPDVLLISRETASNDTVDMQLGTSTRTARFGTLFVQNTVTETLRFSGIEAVRTGIGNDSVFGSVNADFIFGEDGADSLRGYGGVDVVDGGLGADNLWGGAGADRHIGGDDASIDYARYDDANYGSLTIRLDAPSLNTGAAAGDTYVGIEGLVGGVFNDTVVGNGTANFLFGGGGNDNVYGQGGADYLNGGAGTNNLYGGAGADQHIGGSGVDYARYDDANYGNLTIRLDGGVNVGAVAIGDTYTGIEGLVGGLGNDVVIGNAANNQLFGGGGADYIDGRAGSDYLSGGAGADRFVFATALSAITNVDRIADFAHALDDIVLSQAIFAGIGATLDASEFQVGMANAATDRIIYNNITGQLFYDSNGNGAGGQTLFATVTAGTVLSTGDFVMV
jgi:Ca2+-binding RTX toxin-like protein